MTERMEGIASRPLGALLVSGAAVAVYALRARGWPLTGGRDLDEYVYAYLQLDDADPVLPWSLLFRTPLTPIVAGFALDMLEGALAEVVMALLFAVSVVCWSVAARAFGPWVAIATALALLVYPAYGLLFHELSSEPVFATAFSVLALLVVRAADDPSTGRWAAVGLGIAVCALARPGNVVLLALALLPLLLPGAFAERIVRAAAVGLAALLPLVGWAAHNGLRYEEWTLARGGNAIIPFYRAFITDRIVSPANGPSSQELADAVRRQLLTREPYRSYGVTLEEVFSSGSFRIHEDLYLLSDEVFGWSTDYRILREAGIEAVRAHRGTYARGVGKTVWLQLSESLFRGPPAAAEAEEDEEQAAPALGPTGLPEPSEGEPIPGGQVAWISRPDNAIRQVWRSPTEFRFAFADPSLRPRFETVLERRDELL
ncbi:MAG: glycosyltransferase family 39 protein, partial [Thermoleophilia bacterium]|nr:glycosyltransferase family 39 protein [Gaiellaceae bacterium]MDW8339652.1 glycosyltransferase family 39 protein [Thermoleophilia bacterium]